MMTKSVRLRPGADDEHVARIQAAIEAPVEQEAIDEAPQAQRDGYQDHRADHDSAGNIVGVNQVERAGEQQAGGETGLRAQPLLMQKVGDSAPACRGAAAGW